MRGIISGVVVTLAVVLLTHSSADVQELKKLSLDDASAIGMKIETDTTVKTEGKASVKVTTLWPILSASSRRILKASWPIRSASSRRISTSRPPAVR